MKNLFGWLNSVFVAVAIGTFVSLLVLLGMLWWKGTLADERLLGMIAALQGIDISHDAPGLMPLLTVASFLSSVALLGGAFPLCRGVVAGV